MCRLKHSQGRLWEIFCHGISNSQSIFVKLIQRGHCRIDDYLSVLQRPLNYVFRTSSFVWFRRIKDDGNIRFQVIYIIIVHAYGNYSFTTLIVCLLLSLSPSTVRPSFWHWSTIPIILPVRISPGVTSGIPGG